MTVGMAAQLPEAFLARELLLPTISSKNLSLLCLLSQEVIAASHVLLKKAAWLRKRERWVLSPDLVMPRSTLRSSQDGKFLGM